MKSAVVDASVAAKWCVDLEEEILVPQAVRLLEAYTNGHLLLAVPDLFWAELGNILWKAGRAGRVAQNRVPAALTFVRNLRLPTYPSLSLIEDALAIAQAYQRSVYDCLYLALATKKSIDLITADQRLVNAVAGWLPVTWLGAVSV